LSALFNGLIDWLVLDWDMGGLTDKDTRIVVYKKMKSAATVVCLKQN
jgi:hypothetical protein